MNARMRQRRRPSLHAVGGKLLFALIVAIGWRGAAMSQGSAGLGHVTAIEGSATVVRNGHTMAVT